MDANQRKHMGLLSGTLIGALGGLIGLGGAEFRLPVLVGLFRLTTTRLMALLRITASRVGSRNRPTRTGRRNSAPPRPIRPPRVPMRVPESRPMCLR